MQGAVGATESTLRTQGRLPRQGVAPADVRRRHPSGGGKKEVYRRKVSRAVALQGEKAQLTLGIAD